MLKYVDTIVSFQEIPDEISLCINISNCPNNCKGCHSAYLKQDIGSELNTVTLQELIDKNAGVSCICFMGGDQDVASINELASSVLLRADKPRKIAWYSGRNTIPSDLNLELFDFIKIGPYIEEMGPLTNPNTNQIMFKIDHTNDNIVMKDITYKFQKH